MATDKALCGTSNICVPVSITYVLYIKRHFEIYLILSMSVHKSRLWLAEVGNQGGSQEPMDERKTGNRN